MGVRFCSVELSDRQDNQSLCDWRSQRRHCYPGGVGRFVIQVGVIALDL